MKMERNIGIKNYFIQVILKNKRLIGLLVVSSLLLIVFEGISIGMLIPLLKVLFVDGAKEVSFKLADLSFSFSIYAILSGVFVLVLLKNVFGYLSGVYTAKLNSMITFDLRKRIFDKLMDMKIEFFNDESMGKINNCVVGEAQRAGKAAYALLKLVLYSSVAVFYVGWLFFLNMRLTWSCSVFLLIIYLSSFYFIKKAKKISSFISGYRNKLSTVVNESFYGIKIAKLFSRENEERNRFNGLALDNYSLDYYSGRLLEIPQPVTQVFAAAGLVILILAGMSMFKEGFKNQLPYMTAYFFIIFRLLSDIATINTSRSQYLIHRSGFISVFDILNYEAGNRFIDGSVQYQGLKKAIRFDNVCFSYPRNNNFQLKDVSIAIPKNKITAIVGPSGSGKSTIIDLLCRLYDPQGGNIYIDDINLKDLKIDAFKNTLGVVSQEVVLFNDTVKANILYSKPDASDEEFREAFNLAHCDEFISSLPQGCDTVIGERGVKLSGGQKQRISIARAFLRKPEIIILDEATSSLDSRAQQFIKEAISRLMSGKTVIVIAHRLDTIENADQVILINTGRIETHGLYKEMIKNDRFTSLLYPQGTKDNIEGQAPVPVR